MGHIYTAADILVDVTDDGIGSINTTEDAVDDRPSSSTTDRRTGRDTSDSHSMFVKPDGSSTSIRHEK